MLWLRQALSRDLVERNRRNRRMQSVVVLLVKTLRKEPRIRSAGNGLTGRQSGHDLLGTGILIFEESTDGLQEQDRSSEDESAIKKTPNDGTRRKRIQR